MSTYDFSSLYTGSETTFPSPVLLQASVVHGFKRGSKELGIPTANLSMDDLGQKGQDLKTGIYFGWCMLQGRSYYTVVSVGWNPFYKNEKKTVEAHLISKLDDFYGENISILLFGYLRDEANFGSLDELIACIHNDIQLTQSHLERSPEVAKYAVTDNWIDILKVENK